MSALTESSELDIDTLKGVYKQLCFRRSIIPIQKEEIGFFQPLEDAHTPYRALTQRKHTRERGKCPGDSKATVKRLVVPFRFSFPITACALNTPLNAINPSHPKIGVHILLTVLYTFPVVMTLRIWLTVKSSFSWRSFLSSSWPKCFIQQW